MQYGELLICTIIVCKATKLRIQPIYKVMAVNIVEFTVLTFASRIPVLILRRAPRLPGRLLELNFQVNVF